MEKLTVELCSVGHPPVSLEALEVSVPGSAGVFTVLPGHTPILTGLSEGVVIVYSPTGDRDYFAVHCGFCEIADNTIKILADTMEAHAEIDEERAKAALKRAEDLLEKREPHVDLARADAAAARARARLEAQSLSD